VLASNIHLSLVWIKTILECFGNPFWDVLYVYSLVVSVIRYHSFCGTSVTQLSVIIVSVELRWLSYPDYHSFCGTSATFSFSVFLHPQSFCSHAHKRCGVFTCFTCFRAISVWCYFRSQLPNKSFGNLPSSCSWINPIWIPL
jgi:hypothetical protein